MVRNRVDREAESMQHAVDGPAMLAALDSGKDARTAKAPTPLADSPADGERAPPTRAATPKP